MLFLSLGLQFIFGILFGFMFYIFLGQENIPQIIILKPFFFNKLIKICYLILLIVYLLLNTSIPAIYNISMKEYLLENICICYLIKSISVLYQQIKEKRNWIYFLKLFGICITFDYLHVYFFLFS